MMFIFIQIMVKSKAESEARFLEGIQNAAPRAVTAIKGLTTLPTASAALKKDEWAVNVVAAKEKWASALASVTKEDYDSAVEAGFARIATYTVDDVSKFGTYIDELTNLYNSVSDIETQVVTKLNASYLSVTVTSTAKIVRIITNSVIMRAVNLDVTDITTTAFSTLRDAVIAENYA